MKPSIFTPNVRRGEATDRYRLYRHAPNLFSIAPNSPRFRANAVADTCGLPECYCGAYLIPGSKRGHTQMKKTEVF